MSVAHAGPIARSRISLETQSDGGRRSKTSGADRYPEQGQRRGGTGGGGCLRHWLADRPATWCDAGHAAGDEHLALARRPALGALYDEPARVQLVSGLLLLLTLFRLALNVASTRLILTHGQAGQVIQAFGEFVIGGNYAVGLVLFLILIGINFIVITKGAGRVAEVAARFTLDAMPGKQMAIDADLNAGLIDETEARRRREEISRQADFYGAMDGSSKFVKGDAIAALIITFINIIGGIFIGVVQKGLPFSQACEHVHDPHRR